MEDFDLLDGTDVDFLFLLLGSDDIPLEAVVTKLPKQLKLDVNDSFTLRIIFEWKHRLKHVGVTTEILLVLGKAHLYVRDVAYLCSSDDTENSLLNAVVSRQSLVLVF